MAAGISPTGTEVAPGQETILFAKRMGYHKIGIATVWPCLREPDLG